MSGRVLVVDDTASNRIILKAKLAAQYYDVLLAEDGGEALARAAEMEPDIILLDVMMPGLDGFEVCRRLKASEALAHIPVVMVTALNSPEERLKGLEAGADDFLSKPFCDLALLARVRNLVRMKMMFDELRLREATTRELGLHALLAAEDPFSLAAGHALFVAGSAAHWAAEAAPALGIRTRFAHAPAAALAGLAGDIPDAVVLGPDLGGGEEGLRLVSALRARPETRHAAIICAVPGTDPAPAARLLDLGANDYILEPFERAELFARLGSQLRRKLLSDRLRSNLRDGLRLAMVDPLTGLFNRRYATRHLEAFAARARQSGRPFAALILDLDRFKAVNDRHGHDAGDEVLQEFARRLKDSVRSVDLVARLGGEEFLVAMPDVSAAVAAQVAERIRAAVETPDFRVRRGSARLRVTVSIGVALSHPGGEDALDPIRRADEALYASKNGGRNRVTMCAA
jgi:two-component system cell cycle response regulator